MAENELRVSVVLCQKTDTHANIRPHQFIVSSYQPMTVDDVACLDSVQVAAAARRATVLAAQVMCWCLGASHHQTC